MADDPVTRADVRPGVVRSCVDHCRDPLAMRRTITVALIVGTLLTLVNQGARLAAGDVDAATAARVAASYLIPWCVSSAGFISARRTRGRAHGADLP
jgi:hypothetical protein